MTERRSDLRLFRHLSSTQGFSMIELIVVMGIFMTLIMISSGAFDKIAKASSKLLKSSDSNIQGIVGLEIMRYDLESAGYGLPWPSTTSSFIYDFDESQVSANFLAKGIDPEAFNDKNIPASVDVRKAPRAIQSAAATGSAASAWELGRDYIVIKSTTVGGSNAAKKWSYIEGLAGSSSLKEWGGADDLVAGDRVITLKTLTVEKKAYRDLVAVSTTDFSYSVPTKSGGKFVPPAAYQADTADIFLVYGVGPHSTLSASLSYPYNRVDYFIDRPTQPRDMPARCAPGTGILYKGNVKQVGGGVIPDPLLECVADMQVIYSLDTTKSGGVNFHGNEDILSSLSADEIRAQLKEVRVYILVQDGQKDTSYTFPASTVQVGEFGLGRAYNLALLDGIGSEWKHYRWKVYTLVVSPKNINN